MGTLICGLDAINVTSPSIQIYQNTTPSASGTSQVPTKAPFRFNIPKPTKHFKGREDTLKAVRDYFNKPPADTSDVLDRTVVIAGSGGIGKTEFAYKLAAEIKDTCVAWINAETEQSKLDSFLALAKDLGIVEQDHKNADMDLVKRVYRHIDQHYGSVLFIFDNAMQFNGNGSESGIYDYLPREALTNQPNILITTQTHKWGRQIKMHKIDGLDLDDSLKFFRSAFHVNPPECNEEFRMLDDITEGYPLVMNLAASNIDYHRHNGSVEELKEGINGYIQEFNKKKSKILTEEMQQWPTSYKKTFAAAWQLTFKGLEQEPNGREALEILQIMSFYDHSINVIDVYRIVSLSTECDNPDTPDSERLPGLFRLLEKFYACKVLKDARGRDYALVIHRLVQLAVRKQTNWSHALERIRCQNRKLRRIFGLCSLGLSFSILLSYESWGRIGSADASSRQSFPNQQAAIMTLFTVILSLGHIYLKAKFINYNFTNFIISCLIAVNLLTWTSDNKN